MKMYYTGSWGFDIKEIDVISKSETSVWIMDHTNKKRRELNKYYFDTWEDAKKSIVDRKRKDLEGYERHVEYAKKELQKAINITK